MEFKFMLDVPLEKFSYFIASHPVLVLTSRLGRHNTLCPLTWYLPLSCDPPMLGISLKPSSQSYHSIRETGEFLLAVPPDYMAKAVHFCGLHSGRDMDKLRYLNYTAYRAKEVSPLRVAGCMAYIECRVREITKCGNRPFLSAEVISLYVDPRYADEEGWFDDVVFIHYLGGSQYRVGDEIVDLSAYRPGYIPPDSIGMDFGKIDLDLH
ncbi:hypothetical protein GF373_14890 [bacterium]|nr:hypothetical protein [bacterium]